MKQGNVYLLGVVLAACLAGCAVQGTVAGSTAPAPGASQSEESGVNNESGSLAALDEAPLQGLYAEPLPTIDATYESSYTSGDRSFTLEDSIENEAELLVYQYYLNEIAADYAGIEALLGDNEDLKISTENEAEDFQNGIYVQNYVLHGLKTFTAQDMQTVGAYHRQEVLRLLAKQNLMEYAVVAADISWQYNAAQEALGPQLPAGRYVRYFLLCKTKADPTWKLYEMYWEYFMDA